MKKIKLSELKNRIKIQYVTNVPDGCGGSITAWKDYEEVWAKIMPMTFMKNILQSVKGFKITHVIIIRFREDIDTNMRLIIDEMILEIDKIQELESQKYLRIDTITRGKCC